MEVSYAQAQLLRPVWSEKFLGCGTPDRCIVCLLHCALASGAVYCNRSCLFVCVFVALWVCYHDNSKLHTSIFAKLGL